MDEKINKRLRATLLELADDELILAHRDSEWTGHAPILEEDIAFSNIALDELGHSIIWFSLLSDLDQSDSDQLVFFREPEDFRNILLTELPKGDWAFTILRQYLFDTAEIVKLDAFRTSSYKPISGAAEKIIKEETYHLMHTGAWVTRLGCGTEESHKRMQNALNEIWPYISELFEHQEGDDLLLKEGIISDKNELRNIWNNRVSSHLTKTGLTIPEKTDPISGGKSGKHTNHLKILLEDMQSVARSDPGAKW